MKIHVLKIAMSFTLLLAAVLYGKPACACCMVPRSYIGSISQDAQEAIILHQGDQEDLILRINYKIQGDTMPETFAWIVTTPSEPSSYQVADPEIFSEVRRWASRLVAPPRRPSGGGCSLGCGGKGVKKSKPASRLSFSKPVEVGPYHIQPVRALGGDAFAELNVWLKENGFPVEEEKHLKYFIDNQFTFLCIKVAPPKGESQVGSNGYLPPLHLTFTSPRPYYPLMYSSRQGVFDLALYQLTDRPLDYENSASSLGLINWSNSPVKKNVIVSSSSFPARLQKIFNDNAAEGGAKKWHLNLIQCYNVNHGNSIAKWSDDIFFTTNENAPTTSPSTAAVHPGSLWLIVALACLWMLQRTSRTRIAHRSA